MIKWVNERMNKLMNDLINQCMNHLIQLQHKPGNRFYFALQKWRHGQCLPVLDSQ